MEAGDTLQLHRRERLVCDGRVAVRGCRGACRKTTAGNMCPSFMATGEELHSTRGRAHLLWELMQRETLDGGWQNEQVHESLDLCLSCKACKSECPVSVDIATYKSEFLSHHYEHKRRPLTHYAFGPDRPLGAACFVGTGTGECGQHVAAWFGDQSASCTWRRSARLPRFAKPFTRGYKQRPANGTKPKVLLWADTFNNYFHPYVMGSALKVLQDAGFNVEVPKQHLCCGRPLYDFGMLDTAKQYLRTVLDALAPQIREGTPIVVLEPSCATVFRDELTHLYPNDPAARKLHDQTYLLSEFLVRFAPHYQPPQV